MCGKSSLFLNHRSGKYDGYSEYLGREILWSWSILAKGEPLVRSLSSPNIITLCFRPNIFILGQTLFLASSSVLVTYHKHAIYWLCILDLHLDQRLLKSTPLFYRIHIFHGMRSGTNNRIKKSVGLGRKKETITPCPEIMWTATQKKLPSAPLQIDLYKFNLHQTMLMVMTRSLQLE